MERRKHRRHQYEAIISHDILSSEIKPSGKMYNFSQQGLYFETNHTFLPLEEIFVEIIDRSASSEAELELLFDVEIIWRKRLEDGPYRYGYGARFKFPNETIAHKIKSAGFKKPPLPPPRPEPGDEADAREFPRQRCQKWIWFKHGDQVSKGLVTNISRGGAFVRTPIKFSLGRKIRMKFTNGKTKADIQRLGWIVRVNTDGFGLSFDRRSGTERRYDLDRRLGKDRRRKKEGDRSSRK